MGSILFAKARYIREKAKVDAARITQKSGNERRAQESSLQRFSQSLANKNRMDAAGAEVSAMAENLSRGLAESTRGDINRSIAAAEELGATTAALAASGVGGSSFDMYKQTVQLHNAIQEDLSDEQRDSYVYASQRAMGSTMSDAVSGQSNNLFLANLDYTQYVDPPKPNTLKNIAYLGAAAAATVFGGPQAGRAVLSLHAASEAARWGDFGAADQSINNALGAGLGAMQDRASMRGGKKASASNTQPPPVSPHVQSKTRDPVRFNFAPGGFGANFRI